MWHQTTIQLQPKPQGMHLVTREIVEQLPEIASLRVGVLHLFIQHTSAGLLINENADPTVRSDFEVFMQRLVPEGLEYFDHTLEGPDDMPAHIKSSLLGHSISIPISNGQLALGTWQGIYLAECRYHGGARRLIATINGA
ncbi:YjbQ family protein [Bermanella marisrubri]|uniref:Secondary thiamine-phosphate synthase enzyme n=1 Tax=Bermanella marisrubri TaxID=207949 RepID=Q1N4Z4_9GAMM|nr:secondary thiamine-phosphate synthase enzyme YjbQ [Bermanella marisrubri]EAT13284.1 hypothetical protein RED65_00950 [Oceanobacter sp. RED65] [Bermanella marisrubri]QIZ84047.1 YjbQ family protein [Bermanella marisrubri]